MEIHHDDTNIKEIPRGFLEKRGDKIFKHF